MWTVWWVWALIAAALGILELALPTHLLLGFAIGAGIVALGLGFGFLGALTGGAYGLAILLVIFALASLAAWLALRAVFGRPGATPETFDRDIND